MHAVLRYTAKYISKSEKTSQQVLRAMQKMMRFTDETDSIQKTIHRLMNKIIGNRDYSKNEMCFLASGHQYFKSSYQVKVVNLYFEKNGVMNFDNPYYTVNRKPFLQRYMQRSPEYENMNIDEYSLKIDFQNGKEKQISEKTLQNRVCRFQPRYPKNPKHEKYAEYCRYNLIRYKPFRNLSELFDDEDLDQDLIEKWTYFVHTSNMIDVEKWKQDYENALYVLHCMNEGIEIINPPHQLDTNYIWYDRKSTEIDWDEEVNVCTDMNQLHKKNLNYSEETLENIDKIFKKYRNEESSSFDFDSNERPNITRFDLKGHQLTAFDIVKNHVKSPKSEQLLMLTTGRAGTGKSRLIHAINNLLQNKGVVTATTGVASFNVKGMTIHSLLKLTHNNLQPETIQKLQKKL